MKPGETYAKIIKRTVIERIAVRRWRVEKSIPDHFVHHCADHVCVASMIILLFISLIHER